MKKESQNTSQKLNFSRYQSVLAKARFASVQTKGIATGMAFVIGREGGAQDDQNIKKFIQTLIRKYASSWQLQNLSDQLQREVIHFSGKTGPVWIFRQRKVDGPVAHHSRLEDSAYSWHRDQLGSLIGYARAYQLKNLNIEFFKTEGQQELGCLVGLELASYSYKSIVTESVGASFPQIFLRKNKANFDKELLNQAINIGAATNLARHLVNSPPNFLNPQSMAKFIQEYFAAKKNKHKKNCKIHIWQRDRLQKEKMGLLLGVGQGSNSPPCLIHIEYRPSRNKKLRPIAFVGKGVTFDTGGLDLKPSSNMRLMKKDMGGVAALAGLASWLVDAKYPLPVDIYLGLAENSVDANSMRPSDVLTARNGMTVEIHNTDAEGRLVLADVLDFAVTRKGADEPHSVINVATLTGAIKAGLGSEIAGLFSNHDGIAEEINRAGSKMGELNWRMPLFQKYTKGMDTPFADIVNCTDGFGGAITAALFLEKFVRNKPWAHLDIYAWNDKPTGSLSFAGGNGQPVQSLIEFLNIKASEE